MNRIEFMTELAALLQDVPVEERREAMQYYNDYFDDAGEENEEQVISELGSPAKVAATIKADLGSQAGDYAEYSENGYTDSRFDQKEMPAGRDYQRKEEKEPPKTSRALKIVLIIAIILVGAPVLIPLGVGITLAVLGCIIALFCAFIALVIASVAVAIAGIVVFCVGIATLIPELAVGLALVGTGLILTVLGVIATVASVKLCLVVFRGSVEESYGSAAGRFKERRWHKYEKGMEDILDSMRGNGSDWLCVLCDRQGAGCYDRYDRRTLSAWHRGVFPQLYGG